MSGISWANIHSRDQSWRAKLIGDLSSAYVIPRYVELFEKYFRKPGRFSFLELGSGNGDLVRSIMDKKFDFIERYTVSECFPEGVAWLKEQGLEAMLIDAERIAFPDASFDVLLSFDVMHHVKDPARMGYEMLRTARGRLFLTESNGLSVGRKLKELTPAHRRAGEKSYTPGQYRSFFTHPGFKIKHFEIYPLVFPIPLPRKMTAWLVAFNRWIENVPFLKWQCSNVAIYLEYERTKM
ncbi:MAG: methyltransferase domain-containing protein [Candidatus Omnitrophica bacterium]|nr:methyltransferase domain-containing protein [Candidatus Omnitrophota bacterium]MDD5671479.1 methyltransferase domain-containing protein [Candidatus Omnitrophota bacterium]